MYLTQFEINTQRRRSRELLASAQRMHASILHAFSSDTDPGRVLWRIDHGEHGRRELWISSAVPPDLSALVEDCGWPATTRWRTADLTHMFAGLRSGQQWRFRLTANPVAVLPADGSRGKVVPLTMSGCLPWLDARAAKAGFSVARDAVRVSRLDSLRFRRDRTQVVLRQAQFDGALTVVDPVALRGALLNGIGRAKGYGCGLMTLAPLS